MPDKNDFSLRLATARKAATDNEHAYRDCACRDCFEIAIGVQGALCSDCEEAGCLACDCHNPDCGCTHGECCAPNAYCD